MVKFKIGDRVQIIHPDYYSCGKYGTITAVVGPEDATLYSGNVDGIDYWFATDALALVTPSSEAASSQVGGEHYKSQKIQPWDYMESCMSSQQFEGYLRGNVLKYVSRYDKKNGVEDLRKAKHYLEKLLEVLTK